MKNDDNRIWMDDNKKIVDAFEKDFESVSATYKTIRKTSFYANILFILYHLSSMIFFFVTGYELMGFINLGSTVFYLLLFIFFKIKRLDIFIIACGVEIGIYMTAATLIFGFPAGFHLCLLGLCILAFFTSYFSKKARNTMKPIPWGIVLFIDYVFLFFWSLNNETYYKDIPQYIYSILFVIHLVVVFGFTCSFCYWMINYSLKLEKRILRDSKTDKLTQIGNRQALEDYVASLDLKNETYSLTIFDIDDFKKINDQYGHLCGDIILRKIADMALTTKQHDDFVIRYGGEEFVIVSKIDNTFDITCDILDLFRKRIESTDFDYDDVSHHITITMGVALYKEGYTLEDWVHAADEKLYLGKSQGKNQLVK